MITGDFNDQTLRALAWCFSTPHVLTPCGSRYFGDAKDFSDFDFVSEEGAISSAEFEASGFTERWDEEKKRYADLNSVGCWQAGKVQVIICKSLERRLAARRHIQANGLNRKDINVWDEFYQNNP